MCVFILRRQLHARQQMGDPGGAREDRHLCAEEPEACYRLPVHGPSGELSRHQRPQSHLQLRQNTGSAWVTLLHHQGVKTKSKMLFYHLDVPTDSPSTIPGVDHRHIQKELGDVLVHLHAPTIVSSSAVRVQWTVSMQARR